MWYHSHSHSKYNYHSNLQSNPQCQSSNDANTLNNSNIHLINVNKSYNHYSNNIHQVIHKWFNNDLFTYTESICPCNNKYNSLINSSVFIKNVDHNTDANELKAHFESCDMSGRRIIVCENGQFKTCVQNMCDCDPDLYDSNSNSTAIWRSDICSCTCENNIGSIGGPCFENVQFITGSDYSNAIIQCPDTNCNLPPIWNQEMCFCGCNIGIVGGSCVIKYRLNSDIKIMNEWGTQYLKHLAAEIRIEMELRLQAEDDPEKTADLISEDSIKEVVHEIVLYYMDNNAETDAIHLLLEVERKDKERGQLCSVASVGTIMLWDEEAANSVDCYFESTQSHIRAGAYLAIGISCSGVKSESGMGMALLSSPALNEDSSKALIERLCAILGLGLSYAGQEIEEDVIHCGIVADIVSRFAEKSLNGRVYSLFVVLLFEAVFLLAFAFGKFTNSLGYTIFMMIMFSLGVQAAEGVTFAIVPFVQPKAIGPVSGIVGAGGNMGAMIFAFCIFTQVPTGVEYWVAWLILAIFVFVVCFCVLFIKFTDEEIRAADETMNTWTEMEPDTDKSTRVKGGDTPVEDNDAELVAINTEDP